jgi:hypothetical protein
MALQLLLEDFVFCEVRVITQVGVANVVAMFWRIEVFLVLIFKRLVGSIFAGPTDQSHKIKVPRLFAAPVCVNLVAGQRHILGGLNLVNRILV